MPAKLEKERAITSQWNPFEAGIKVKKQFPIFIIFIQSKNQHLFMSKIKRAILWILCLFSSVYANVFYISNLRFQF